MAVLRDPRPPLPSPPSPSQSPTKQEVQQGLRPALGKEEIAGHRRTGFGERHSRQGCSSLGGSLPSAGQARASRGVLGAPGPCDSWLTLPASLQRALRAARSCKPASRWCQERGPAPPARLRLCPGQRPPPRPRHRPVSGDWAFGGSAGRRDRRGLASVFACFPPHSSSRLIHAAANVQGGDRS